MNNFTFGPFPIGSVQIRQNAAAIKGLSPEHNAVLVRMEHYLNGSHIQLERIRIDRELLDQSSIDDDGWDVMDGKRDRFIRIATKRTNMILNKTKVLGNCANRSAYEYSEADINKIFNEIEKELKLTKAKFRIENGSRKKEFTL